jgi:Tfp pilus assembly protein PilF
MVPKAECTTRLDALGPVRHLEVVQNIVTTWAKKAANAIRSERATLKPALLREAETEYKNGAFSRAAQKYEVLLAEAPAHLDVRNNYALAQMHLGHDVAAQMQLEALHELDPRYVPAMVNLTVLYERAWPGDGKRIASMAEDALMLAPKTGPVVFNAAWCRQRACQMSSASELLKPLVSDNYGKAAVLERATWADCN